MDYHLGLNRLRSQLSQLDEHDYLDLLSLESRLLDSLAVEDSFGPNEMSRVEKARVMRELNALALRTIDVTFNDLCSAKFSLPRRGLLHNLPHPDYGQFIGREQEVGSLLKELRPHPKGPWPVIIVHGIGGSGKTTLALEVAWRLVRDYQLFQPSERFEAIVWVTAKDKVLTTAGIKPKIHYFRSITDIFNTIAFTLEHSDVANLDIESKETQIRQMLSNQRTLLVLDNLETVDDPRIEAFLGEPIHTTKVLITSRHKLEGLPGKPIRLLGMTREECFTLIERECHKEEQNEVILIGSQTERLVKLTAGIPLAVVWSIGRMRDGRDVEWVLKRLEAADSDIVRFCFDYSMEAVHEDRAAHLLLMALSHFQTEVGRQILGVVTGLDQDQSTLVEALSKLERLSMISRHGDLYTMLPLARAYALAEAQNYPDFQESLARWQLNKDIEIRQIDRLWSEATFALSDRSLLDFEHMCRELAQNLGSALDLWIVGDSPFLQTTSLLGFFVDATSIFSGIGLPTNLPLLFLKVAKLTDQAINDIRDIVQAKNLRSVWLVPFFGGKDLEHARRQIDHLLKRTYALDPVILTHTDILRSVAAQNPQAELRRVVLAQVDLVTISPFLIAGPVPDRMFFGRERELRHITDGIGRNISFAVVGSRRSGKTSFLVYLHRIRLPVAGFRSIFHDCSRTPAHSDFLSTRIEDWQLNAPLNRPVTFRDLLQTPPTDRPLVLLLDEADRLIAGDRSAGWPLFRELRAFASSGRGQLIFGGERELLIALRDPSSPLFNFASEIFLGPSDIRAVEQLVTQPMRQLQIDLVDQTAIVQRIYEMTSGHLNIVQRLCYRLIRQLDQQRTRRITLDDVNAVVEEPQFQEEFLDVYWERASSLERIITVVLSQKAGSYHLNDIRQLLSEQAHIQPSTTAIRAALDRLVDFRHILQHSRAGYAFAVKAFPLILSKQVAAEELIEILVEQYEHTKQQA